MDPRSFRPGPLTIALILATAAIAGTKHEWERPVFVYAHHPDLPMERFAAGHLGIPEPAHARIYLYAVYRYLENKPFTPAEQQRWLTVWNARANDPRVKTNAEEVWFKARRRVPFPDPLQNFTAPVPFQQRAFVSSANCQDDAFHSAAATLAARIRRYGPASAELKFWLDGQDAVFLACYTSAPQSLAPAPAHMPPLLRADRDYHNAAAALYAHHFDEAAVAFRKIAADPASPWSIWAPYQAARALLYKARETQSEAVYKTALAEAEAAFQAVVNNPRLRSSHRAAEYLMLRCMMITHRKAAIERIGRRLLGANWAETDLSLYLNAMDDYGLPLWTTDPKPPQPALWPRDALSQWILHFQHSRPAMARWRQSQSPAWLYAALWNPAPADAETLIPAALANGALPLRYLAAGQLTALGKFDPARQILAKVLTEMEGFPSARNRALQLHTRLAPDWPQFLLRAPRKVILTGGELDWREFHSTSAPNLRYLDLERPEQRESSRQWAIRHADHSAALEAQPRWDEVDVAVLTERAPLRILREAASNPNLSPNLRDDLALVVFTRAVILNQWETATAIAPRIVSPAIPAFLAHPGPETAALVLLDLPGARPFPAFGYGRAMAPAEFDEFSRNWWSRMDVMESLDEGQSFLIYHSAPKGKPFTGPLPFATADDERETEEEWAALRRAAPNGLNWIASQIVPAIEKQPTRPDAPELLFRILLGTRSNWWTRFDKEALPPKNAIARSARLLSTRHRRTKWFRAAAAMQTWELAYQVQ